MSVYCLLPITLMAIFGILTVRQIHRTQTLLSRHATSNCRREHHLIRMVLVNVILTLILTIPFEAKNLYFAFDPENSFSKELYRILEDISRLLLYVNHTMTFYINLIASSGFRQEFINVTESWRTKWKKEPIRRDNELVTADHTR